MLSGIATSSTACSGSRSTPIATNTATRMSKPDQVALLDQRHHHSQHRPPSTARPPRRTPRPACAATRRSRRSAHRAPPGSIAITIGGPTSPAKAAMPPAMPRKREPNTTDRLTMFGPGRKWHSAKVSLNSSAVIQRCWSTMPRRAQTSTPPKPASDILANARNSSSRPGWIGGSGWNIRRRDGGRRRIRRHGRDLERRRSARPTQFGVFRCAVTRGFPALFFSTFAPYIEGAGSPAMEINGRRNKPFGPGGSTRRLHPSPSLQAAGFGGGETGSTRA